MSFQISHLTLISRRNRGSSCTKCRGGASAVFAATARCVSAARLPCTMYKGSLARKPWSKLRKRRKVTALRRFGRGAKARWGANGRDGQCSHCHHGLNLIFRDITFSPQAHPRPLAPPSRRPYRRPLRSLALLLAPPRASRPLAPTRATSAQTAARRLYYAVCRPRIAPIRAPSRLRAPLTPDTPTHDTRSRLTDAQLCVFRLYSLLSTLLRSRTLHRFITHQKSPGRSRGPGSTNKTTQWSGLGRPFSESYHVLEPKRRERDEDTQMEDAVCSQEGVQAGGAKLQESRSQRAVV